MPTPGLTGWAMMVEGTVHIVFALAVGESIARIRRYPRRFMRSPESIHVDPEYVRDTWTNRPGEYSPAYYAYYGSDETSTLIHNIVSGYLDCDAAILELGCGSGRHLAHLADHGFENLSGVDINAEAFDVMEEHYPRLATDGTFHCSPIEDIITDFDDGEFDAVYTVETLQHLHPDVEWVFEEVARITDNILITTETEEPVHESPSSDADVNYVDDDTPLYYRDWSHIFTSLGLVEVDTVRGDRDTTRTFRASS